jgi:uncharacterized protein
LKLQLDHREGTNIVTGYTADSIEINKVVYKGAIRLRSQGPVESLPELSFDTLTEADFAVMAGRSNAGLAESAPALRPDVILLGTGAKQRFAHPRLTESLKNDFLAVECMSTHAACRTFNILVGEGRQVAAILIA